MRLQVWPSDCSLHGRREIRAHLQKIKIQIMNEERPEMLSQSNDFRPQATERLFLAVVHQAIADVLENGKEAKEAERWLLSKDFDALDKLFARPARPVESPLQKGISDAPNLINEANRSLCPNGR